MQVLILSCNTGEGHNSCAKAIKEVCDINRDICLVEDALRFISEETYKVMSKGHDYIYRHFPRLFSRGYGLAEKHTSVFEEDSMMYNFFARGADEIRRLVTESGYDTIICTHPFAALMVTEARRRYGLSVPSGFVATDYTCSPSVKDSRLDFYFIPDERLRDDFISENITADKLVYSGIPIRQRFYISSNKRDAKLKLGLNPDSKHLVMMCGSMGCGPIRELSAKLAQILHSDWELTVVCGTNYKLKSYLDDKLGNIENVHIKGFVEDMSLLLDSTDLYLTKPGGISVSEAAAKHLPMVFINAVAGCEDYNSTFFSKVGCAAKGGSVSEFAELCTELLTDDEAYGAMVNAYDTLNIVNAAKCICDTFRDLERADLEC